MGSRTIVLGALVVAAASGCSTDPMLQVSADQDASTEAESSTHYCDDADSVELGTPVTGEMGRASAKLVDAAPWPAKIREPAAWTVQLLTASGDPLADASVSSVKVLDHLHNIARMPEQMTLDDSATLRVDVRFLLRSLWLVQINVTTPAGDDVIELPACVKR